jgi:hypothetical protein
VFAHLFHHFPHLRVRRLHGATQRIRRVPCLDSGSLFRMGRCNCRPWGGVIVAQQCTTEGLMCAYRPYGPGQQDAACCDGYWKTCVARFSLGPPECTCSD